MFFSVLLCLLPSQGKDSQQMPAKSVVSFLGEQKREISVEPLSWSACGLPRSSKEKLFADSLLIFSTDCSGASVK